MSSTGSGLITLASQPLAVQFIKLPRAIYVWVGVAGSPPTLSSLATAVPGCGAAQSLASTTLFGSTESEDLAARLCRRTGRVVLLSFDGIEGAAEELSEVEAQIFLLIK